MRNRMLATLCGLAMMGLAGAAKAVPVDLQLSLVIDSSGSINDVEFGQQISGYSQAFRDPVVIDSITSNPDGIAVNTILYATGASEVIEFTRLTNTQEVNDFADQLDLISRLPGGTTNIEAGINLAVDRIANNGLDSSNIIIDVSGDGVQLGGDAAAARDAALLDGVSQINAIAVGDDFLLSFFEDNVIGGTDAFALRADNFDDFDTAIANKLGIELGVEPRDPVAVPEPGTLSMIGLGVLALGFVMRRRRSV